MRWVDKNPDSDAAPFKDPTYAHPNYVTNLSIAKFVDLNRKLFLEDLVMMWRVELDLSFQYPNGYKHNEIRELKAYCRLTELNDHSISQHSAAMRRGNKLYYVQTNFLAECIGMQLQISEDEPEEKLVIYR